MLMVNVYPIVPVRAAESEASEMTTQMLFGEEYCVVAVRGKWAEIRTALDDYHGYIDAKLIDESAEMEGDVAVATAPLIRIEKVDVGEIYLPGGSILPMAREFSLGKTKFRQIEDIAPVENPLEAARQFIGAPYLWGGRSVMGIDCSGLAQLAYRICGTTLPRDASQQVSVGREIAFGEHKAGDLAFFENENGKITHVGIVANDGLILHASADVHFDVLDENGIYSLSRGRYTHKLAKITRPI